MKIIRMLSRMRIFWLAGNALFNLNNDLGTASHLFGLAKNLKNQKSDQEDK